MIFFHFPSFPLSKNIKPALQPLLAHNTPSALSQNKTVTVFEHVSLPSFATTRQTTKKLATAGSGEFSFFFFFGHYTVIVTVASSLRGNNTKKANKRPPIYCQKQWSCAWRRSSAVFTYLSDKRYTTLPSKWQPISEEIFWELVDLRK